MLEKVLDKIQYFQSLSFWGKRFFLMDRGKFWMQASITCIENCSVTFKYWRVRRSNIAKSANDVFLSLIQIFLRVGASVLDIFYWYCHKEWRKWISTNEQTTFFNILCLKSSE